MIAFIAIRSHKSLFHMQQRNISSAISPTWGDCVHCVDPLLAKNFLIFCLELEYEFKIILHCSHSIHIYITADLLAAGKIGQRSLDVCVV